MSKIAEGITGQAKSAAIIHKSCAISATSFIKGVACSDVCVVLFLVTHSIIKVLCFCEVYTNERTVSALEYYCSVTFLLHSRQYHRLLS